MGWGRKALVKEIEKRAEDLGILQETLKKMDTTMFYEEACKFMSENTSKTIRCKETGFTYDGYTGIGCIAMRKIKGHVDTFQVI